MKNRPFTSFVIFGAMRSGSNLLEKFLNQYGGLVCHGELFHAGFIGKPGVHKYLGMTRKERNNNPETLLKAVRQADPEKIVGYRFFQAHDQRLMTRALIDPHCAKIILTRNPVESFVSLAIARETDQWLISDPAHRKEAQIHFDLAEFADYVKERDDYYGKISKALRLSEQPYFEIDYETLNDVTTINSLTAFLGVTEKLDRLEQPIKRQNPGSLSQKILNYNEISAALDLPDKKVSQPSALKRERETGTDLSRIYFSKNKAIALAPVPSTPIASAQEWMTQVDGTPPQNGFSAKAFSDWQGNHPDPIFFTVVDHPLRRAYSAFMHKIFPTGPDSYLKIREQLQRQFGLLLPPGDVSKFQSRAELGAIGYGIDEHRTSFKQFLVFVAGNLESQTDIRQDGKWQSQSEIIRRYRVLHPVLHVFNTESLRTDLKYLENKLDLPPMFGWHEEPKTEFSFSLSDIYDDEIEALARAAYAPDYERFGYAALSGL